jgi:hypothetical protein
MFISAGKAFAMSKDISGYSVVKDREGFFLIVFALQFPLLLVS